VTTYIHDNRPKIHYNNVLIDYHAIFSGYLFNLTAINIMNNKIQNTTVYNLSHFNYNIHSIKTNYYVSINKEDTNKCINLNNLEYDTIDAIHSKLPKILIISAYLENDLHADIICPGNIVESSINCQNSKFIGIVSHIELDDQNKYKIIIIPSYVIAQYLLNIQNKNVTNIWCDINENNVVTKVYKNSKSNIKVGDIINKVNDQLVIKGLVYIKKLNIYVPLQTYLWYHQYDKKYKYIYYLNITRNCIKSNISYDYITINDILAINFNHNVSFTEYYFKQKSNLYKIKLQNISYELIDYLVDKNIVIGNDYIDTIFENPFDVKIDSIIITEIINKNEESNLCKNEFDNYNLLSILMIDQLELIKLNLYQFKSSNSKNIIDFKNLYNKIKKRFEIETIKFKIINDSNEIYNNLNIIVT
jgi:hypothetical protein